MACNYLIVEVKTWLLIQALNSVKVLRTRQNGHHFADDVFICIFSNEDMLISIEISMNVVPKSPNINIPELVQIMVGRLSDMKGAKPFSQPNIVYWRIYASLGLNESIHITMKHIKPLLSNYFEIMRVTMFSGMRLHHSVLFLRLPHRGIYASVH